MKIKRLYWKFIIKYYRFLNERQIRTQTKDIIKKFGKNNARKYAYSTHSCPCYALKMKCGGCKYVDQGFIAFNQGCSPGRKWVYLSQYDINKIKERIKEKVK